MAGPEKTFRIGRVSASVFANEVENSEEGGGKRKLRNVNLQRRFRDGNDWKTATTFGLADLPNAIRVLELSLQYVESQEAESTSG